ncbi:hypothetical protein AAG906_014389 [Vitis piasezkii]
MLTAPPIEGNSDCRARPFHSKLYFDQEAIVALDFYQSMTIRGAPNVVLRPTSFPIAFGGEAMSYFGCFIPYIRGLWPAPLDHGLPVHFEEKSDSFLTNGINWRLFAPLGAPPMVAPLVLPQPIASTTSEPSITISASEFRSLIHTFQTLTTTHAALFQQMAEMRAQDQTSPPLHRPSCIIEPLAPTEDTIPVRTLP